jgi:hypothetical protein
MNSSPPDPAGRINDPQTDLFATAPWRWREEWEAGFVSGEHNLQILDRWFMAMGAVVAFAVANLFIVPTPADREAVWGQALLGVLLLLCGALTVWAVLGLRLDHALTASVFRFASRAGVPGGELAGTIDIPTSFELREGATLTLACLREDNKADRVVHLISSVEELRAARRAGAPGRCEIPVKFPIPGEAPTTTPDDGDPVIRWVAILASKPTRDALRLEFEVPVFSSAESPPGARPEAEE